jgi:hypothetical protein
MDPVTRQEAKPIGAMPTVPPSGLASGGRDNPRGGNETMTDVVHHDAEALQCSYAK